MMHPQDHDEPCLDGLQLVIEAFKKDVDRTLLRENLKRTPEERVVQLMELLRAAEAFREAGRSR